MLRFQTISNDWSNYSRAMNRVNLCPKAKISAHSNLTTPTRAPNGHISDLCPIFWLTANKQRTSPTKMKMIRLRTSNFIIMDEPNSFPS